MFAVSVSLILPIPFAEGICSDTDLCPSLAIVLLSVPRGSSASIEPYQTSMQGEPTAALKRFRMTGPQICRLAVQLTAPASGCALSHSTSSARHAPRICGAMPDRRRLVRSPGVATAAARKKFDDQSCVLLASYLPAWSNAPAGEIPEQLRWILSAVRAESDAEA